MEWLKGLGAGEARGWMGEGLRPRRKRTVDEWADQERYLTSMSSAEPGLWKTSRTPYTREIMRVLSPGSGYREVVLEKGAQVSGTETANNFIGHGMDEDPGPMLMVMPNEGMAKRNSRTRITPMIEACPSLRQSVAAGRTDTVLEKDFMGGVWVAVGANAPAPLRSMPCKKVVLDEEDAYPLDVGGEGDPKELAEARLRTYEDGKLFRLGTPTMSKTSRIDRAYENSDQRRYRVPCPHCGEMQVLNWTGIRWDGDPSRKDLEAWYECAHCGERITEDRKTWMLERGEWVAENPGHHVAGFHLNSLYSPYGWFSWKEAVRMWQRAQESENVKKTFMNTVLGLPYSPDTEEPDWKALATRGSNYTRGEVPQGVGVLTAGVDVQQDRFEIEVVGWGRDFHTWSIDYIRVPGDTADIRTWDRLEAVLGKGYLRRDGRAFHIDRVALDSGWRTQDAYRFSMRRGVAGKVIVIKGMADQPAILNPPTTVDLKASGQRVPIGQRLWPVDGGIAKMELYGWLKQGPGKPGRCLWPMDYDDAYFKMLTAERLVLSNREGYDVWTWEKHRTRNEALDCRVYARAAAIHMGVDKWGDGVWRWRVADGVAPRQSAKVGRIGE